MAEQRIKPPKDGSKITVRADGSLVVPDAPIIGFIEGDGTGSDIWRATQPVLNAAVERAYAGRRRICWMELFAGDKAVALYGPERWLPDETVQAIRNYVVAIKGPLTTPIGGGFRSLNVALRQTLDLYSCIRPVRYYGGVPTPMKAPEKLNITIFRENTEDVYAGIEWQEGSSEADALIRWLNSGLLKSSGKTIRADSGIGIKCVSATGSKRLIRKALRFAVEHQAPTVTMMHKGNIMKFTEGAFRDWGYELSRAEFAGEVVTEEDVTNKFGGKAPAGKVVLKDRIADSMFQQVLLRPEEYHVVATTNLNGDYLSDACAAQVGGLGLAPGANIGDHAALFEATHGTAPKYAGLDKVNPASLILSGVLMLRHLGWNEAADLVEHGLESTIAKGTVTYDLERLMPNATLVSCSEFGRCIVANMR